VSTLRRLRIRTGFVDPNPPQNVLLNEIKIRSPSDAVKETMTDIW
jgi:hypothetical protein